MVLFVTGLGFVAVGMHLAFGKGKPDNTGLTVTVNGIADMILAAPVIYVDKAGLPPEMTWITSIIGATAILFGLGLIIAGEALRRGYDLVPFGNLGIFNTPFCIFGAYMFAIHGMMYLTFAYILWAWIWINITGVAWGKMPPKTLGWTALIEAFVCFFMIGATTIMGVPLP